MRLLTLSLDADLARAQDDAQTNNARERHARYAERLEELHIVVKTLGNHTPALMRLRQNCWVYPTRSANRWWFARDACRLAAQCCRQRAIDAIVCHDPFVTGWIGVQLKRQFGLPLNVHVMADMLDNPQFRRERSAHAWLQLLGRWVLRHADTVRVSTACEQRQLARWLPADRVWAIPLPVETARWQSADGAAVRAQWLQAPWRHLFVTVGRLCAQKDMVTLLRAMRHLRRRYPDARLLIIGDGPERGRVERWRRRWGLTEAVMLLGAIAPARVPDYIAAADGVVLTSRYEGMPRVLLEAALCGTPIVATATAGACELIDDGRSGHLVAIGDAAACAERMAQVLADPARARAMGAAAAHAAAPMTDPEQLMARYLAMWRATVR